MATLSYGPDYLKVLRQVEISLNSANVPNFNLKPQPRSQGTSPGNEVGEIK